MKPKDQRSEIYIECIPNFDRKKSIRLSKYKTILSEGYVAN